MGETCSTCRFRYGRVDEWSGTSSCRRYPPTNVDHPRGGKSPVWPQVQGYDWCGEHQPAQQEGEGE